MVSVQVRRTIPILLVGLTGLLMLLDLFSVTREIGSFASEIRDWGVVIASFSLVVGGAELATRHAVAFVRRTEGKWCYSGLFLLVIFTYVIVGLTLTATSAQYNALFSMLTFPLAQAMLSLLSFYIFSAAVRAFQARNWEATVFLLAGAFALIGNMPFVPTISPQLAAVGPWLFDVPAKGAFRGLLITAAIGGIIISLRVLTGRETGYLGRR